MEKLIENYQKFTRDEKQNWYQYSWERIRLSSSLPINIWASSEIDLGEGGMKSKSNYSFEIKLY